MTQWQKRLLARVIEAWLEGIDEEIEESDWTIEDWDNLVAMVNDVAVLIGELDLPVELAWFLHKYPDLIRRLQ
jgi:hypothetical protein